MSAIRTTRISGCFPSKVTPVDIEATQYWLTTLFTSELQFRDVPGGTIGTNADGVVVTAGFGEKDLGLVAGAQVWGAKQQEVRAELFGIGIDPQLLVSLFTRDARGIQPGARLHGLVFTLPELWERGAPQLTEPDRITTLLCVQPCA